MLIAGVDEAGRGALAGPLVAAAAILGADLDYTLLGDSKVLTAAKRDKLFDLIYASDSYIGVSIVPRNVVDARNVLQATLSGMAKSVARLKVHPELVLIDGNKAPDIRDCKVETIVKGDATEPCISAASIIAKVTRDRIMCRYDEKYPGYAFSTHKGYGTQQHYDAVFEHGLSLIHRRTFTISRQETLFT